MSLRLFLVALATAPALTGGADEQPPAKAGAPDRGPLPAGARARLGNGELHIRVAGSYALLPPEYDRLLLPDTLAKYRVYDLKTGTFDTKNVPNVAPEGSVLVSGDGTRIVSFPPE